MNNDAVKVRHVDVRSAFPWLRVFDCLSLTANPLTLGLSLACLLFLQEIQNIFSVEGTPKTEVFERVANDVRKLIEAGPTAEWKTALCSILTMLVLATFGAMIARLSTDRYCLHSASGLQPTSKSVFNLRVSLLTVQGLALLLLFAAFLLLRVGQGMTSGLSDEFAETLTDVTPSLAAGIFFLLSAYVIAVAWMLSVTAVLVERCDGAEAFARCISYILSRPLRSIAMLSFVTALAVALSAASTLLLDVAGGLHNARQPYGVALITETALANAKSLFGQVVILNTFMTGLPIVYLHLRFMEDGISFEFRRNHSEPPR